MKAGGSASENDRITSVDVKEAGLELSGLATGSGCSLLFPAPIFRGVHKKIQLSPRRSIKHTTHGRDKFGRSNKVFRSS